MAVARAASEGEPGRPEGLDVWTPSRLNLTVRDRLQGDPGLQGIWIEGEVFNLNYHTSGHVYFSLKDAQSAVRCTFFRNANQRHKHIRLQNGMRILAAGGLSVYTPRGEYQFNVQRVMLAGEGELRLKIEELKKRLHAEGLFDPARKQALPFLPTTVGVATAPTGAAVRDIHRTLRRRFPNVNILLAPCVVQGDDASVSIVEAIEALNDPRFGVDVIIAGRGGGSFEDLLPFNDEAVVRAYANSRVPIVSAVGHEIDHPLSDLAADVYAPTPTGAAEMVVPVYEDLVETVDDCGLRLRVALHNRHRSERDRLNRIFTSRVYENPQSMFQERAQSLDILSRELRQALQARVARARSELQNSAGMSMLFERNLSRFARRFSIADERLQNFSPLGTLQRGFAVVRNAKKDVIRRAKDVRVGEELQVLLGEGELWVKVEQNSGETQK